jgi:PAS domain S-box-containing protein
MKKKEKISKVKSPDTAQALKEVEGKLRYEEQLFRALADQSSDIILLVNTEGAIIYENHAVDRILGLKSEERIGKNVLENLHPDDLHLVTNAFNILIRDKNAPTQRDEIRLRHVDGTWRTFEVVGSNLTQENIVQALIINLRDITERKQAEFEKKAALDALQKSEEKYRRITENMSGMVSDIDAQGFFKYVSPSHQKILEYRPEDLLGTFAFDKFHPDDLDRVTSVYMEGVISKTDREVEYRYRHADGHYVWLRSLGHSFYDASGEYVGSIISSSVITERKHAEFQKDAALEALRESEQFLRETQSIALMGGWKANPETDFLQWTEGVYRIIEAPLDYHPSLTEGLKYYTPKTTQILRERMLNILITNEPFVEECEIVTETGKKLWAEVRGLSHVLEGQTPCVIGTIQDITERKQAEEALKNSEAKYRNIFENAVEGIYQSTIGGRFITANAALARMAGYESPEELIESIKDIGTQLYVHPEDREKFMEIRDAKGFVDGFEVEFYKKDGSKFWVVINARAVKDEQGKIIYFEGLIEDITIRKHAEKKLQQTLISLRKAVGTTIQVLVSAVESRDSYTSGHQSRSADLACAIATEMGLAPEKIEGILMAGIIHDIGKLSIPAEILSKPTKLTEIEFALIKEHSRSGYEMLKDVESPWPLAEIVYQHHERMNGSGYPRNLKGDEIIMESQILAVADVVEAMASHRPYRAALGIDTALDEIEKNKGILYDNTIADACLKLFREKGYQLK